MTIGIGMLCAEGVIIAADQASIIGDTQSIQLKVASGFGKNCSFAIANSSNDGFAALTLQGKIVLALERADPHSVEMAEEVIVEQMSLWAAPWSVPPGVEFLIGLCVCDDQTGRWGNNLIYASPPNTILRRRPLDDNRGYDAIGSGAAVTTPLHTAFLKGFTSAQNTLSKVAYLMDKAKRGNMYCGGRTNAVLVRNTLGAPDWINPLDMEAAESVARHLDFYLSWTGSCFFGQTDDGVGQLADGLCKAIKDGPALRNLRFTTVHGEEIYDTSVQAANASETESAG